MAKVKKEESVTDGYRNTYILALDWLKTSQADTLVAPISIE